MFSWHRRPVITAIRAPAGRSACRWRPRASPRRRDSHHPPALPHLPFHTHPIGHPAGSTPLSTRKDGDPDNIQRARHPVPRHHMTQGIATDRRAVPARAETRRQPGACPGRYRRAFRPARRRRGLECRFRSAPPAMLDLCFFCGYRAIWTALRCVARTLDRVRGASRAAGMEEWPSGLRLWS